MRTRGDASPDERRRRGLVNYLRRLAHVVSGDPRPRENRYRDVLLLVAFLLVVWALLIALSATHTANRATRDASAALVRVQEGRQTSVSLTCAALSGVSSAGRAVIAGAARTGTEAQKIAASRRASRYVSALLARVEVVLRQRGKTVSPRDLVLPDGSLDCRTFLLLSNVSDG